MTPLVEERIGEPGTPRSTQWAIGPSLRIMYVNTFRRVGERRRVSATTTSSRSSTASARCRASPTTGRRRLIAPRARRGDYAPSAENRQPWEFVVVRDAPSCAPRSATSPDGRGRRTARVLRDAARPRAARRRRPRRDRWRSAAAPVLHRRVRRHERGLEVDRAVVDLPGDAEPAARRHRARARLRAHHDHHRRSPTSCRRCSRLPDARRAASPSSRSATREAARSAAARAVRRDTPTATATARPGSPRPDWRELEARFSPSHAGSQVRHALAATWRACRRPRTCGSASRTCISARPSANVGTATASGTGRPSTPARSASHSRV